MQCYTPAYHPVTVLPLWIIFWTYTYKIQTYSKIIVQVLNKKAYLYGVFYSATAMVDLYIMLWDTCTIMPFHSSSARLLSSSSPSWYFHLRGHCLILVPLLIDDR